MSNKKEYKTHKKITVDQVYYYIKYDESIFITTDHAEHIKKKLFLDKQGYIDTSFKDEQEYLKESIVEVVNKNFWDLI